jgi:hypothetical protein
MKILFVFLFSFLVGCSAFQPKQQKLTINGYGNVFVNEQKVVVPAIINVDRDKSVTVSRYEGKNVVFTKTISPVPSVWGKLDAWGVYFLYPGIGLFTPGALELETDTIFVK